VVPAALYESMEGGEPMNRIYLTKQFVIPMEMRDCDFNLIIEALKEKKAHIEAYIHKRPEDHTKIWEITRLIDNLQDVLLNQ